MIQTVLKVPYFAHIGYGAKPSCLTTTILYHNYLACGNAKLASRQPAQRIGLSKYGTKCSDRLYDPLQMSSNFSA